jgi:phosphopentomutase
VNPSSSVASALQPHHRQELAINVLSKQESVSQIAKQEQVSRKFIYQQKEIAQQALNSAFDKPEKDNEVKKRRKKHDKSIKIKIYHQLM